MTIQAHHESFLPEIMQRGLAYVQDGQCEIVSRKGFVEILGRQGFQVLQASTVETALETMREAPISLVISDHFLRGASGTELAEKLKMLKPTVPILLHSGAHPETMKNVDAFLNKGEPIAEFLRVVRDLVRRFSS